MISDPLFYLVAVPAVILLGTAKGGFSGIGALSLPLLALAIAPLKGAAIMLPILMVQDVVSVSAYWRKWDVSLLKVMLPGGLAGTACGYFLAAQVSEAAFEIALGLISVVFAARHLLAREGGVRARPTLHGGLFWGAVSGFTSMIANTGAPPFQVYVTPLRLPRDIFVGTMAIFFGVVNWFKLPLFLDLGQITYETILTSVVLFPLAILSTLAGVRLVRLFSTDSFYKVIFSIMGLVGLKLIYDGVAVLLYAA